MKILVINSGSSSIKYQVFEAGNAVPLAKGLVERIGLRGSLLKQELDDGRKMSLSGEIIDHQQAIEYILAILTDEQRGVLDSRDDIKAVGHRVVHGGESYISSVLVNDEVLYDLHKHADMAPLHNPNNLKGIEACRSLIPNAPNVAVFDTAFHHTMPGYAYIYGLPYTMYKRHGIRRYGFHGLSHRYVSERFQELTSTKGEPQRLITIHLGNGCSAAAILDGKSIDTSMGFTPVEGLLMGTRSGDIDPAIILRIMGREELSRREAISLLNKHSGLLGISGVSSDMREVLEEIEGGNKQARLAVEVFTYRIKKYIGSYAAALGGVDGIVFTGGIGENAPEIRAMSLEGLDYLGLKLDTKLNQQPDGERLITTKDSTAEAWVIPTNEEWIIAQDTHQLAGDTIPDA
ncbi:MAG: acetate kinase [Candidatus Marinimicrobia bacterium]|nr:acetate kinase [Candidatus Neomarinimicrobiota bacterium]